jgi:glycosyltransferase involved in cell wall biosynthesis
MRIGFDAKRYYHNNTGLGNYSRDLVDAMSQHFAENEYFLLDKSNLENLYTQNQLEGKPNAGLFWRIKDVLKDIEKLKLDVFHGLSNELPYGKWPSYTQKVVTIHDVIYKLFPSQYPFIDRNIYHLKTKHAIQVADTIIATSEATAKDLIHFYKVLEHKIEVVYQTCSKVHWMPYTASEVDNFKYSKNIEFPFILYVSSFQERKNHLELIKAFAQLPNKETKLLLAGRKGKTYQKCMYLIKSYQLENDVVILTDLEYKELPLLYRSAKGFIYPSMIEGFGIPLLEAACAGLPMAVNDIPVFREIAPPNTLYFNLDNIASITKALKDLIEIKTLQDNSQHLEKFTSLKQASQMNNIYERTRNNR